VNINGEVSDFTLTASSSHDTAVCYGTFVWAPVGNLLSVRNLKIIENLTRNSVPIEFILFPISTCNFPPDGYFTRSQWPRGLGRVLSWTARRPGSWVLLPFQAWIHVHIFHCAVLCSFGPCDGLNLHPGSPTKMSKRIHSFRSSESEQIRGLNLWNEQKDLFQHYPRTFMPQKLMRISFIKL
jgi:hypothetical protein